MRIQGVVLEHHRDVAIARRQVVDPVPTDDEVAVRDVLQPGDHPQRRRLPASRRADEDHELAVRDVEVDRLDRLEAVRVALGDPLELDLSHPVSPLLSLLNPSGTGSSAQPTARCPVPAAQDCQARRGARPVRVRPMRAERRPRPPRAGGRPTGG